MNMQTVPNNQLCDLGGNHFSEQRLNLSSLPTNGPPIVNVMLDLTLRCNLRCGYCFKEKGNEDMSLRVAQDAIIWLIHASDTYPKISVFLIGGEPLLRMDLIEKLVPFGRLRAKEHQKKITFGITTNATLISDTVVNFATDNDIRFHLSLDGIPEVQDLNRPLASGQKSSPYIEAASIRVLKIQPNVMARGCVTPDSVYSMYASYQYFRRLGFTVIGLFPCRYNDWSEVTLQELEKQLRLIAHDWIEEYRRSLQVCFSNLDQWLMKKERANRGTVPCGAGRGLVLIDTQGRIWPCSRFSSADSRLWLLGSIYDNAFSEKNRLPFINENKANCFSSKCMGCVATKICNGACYAENLETTGNISVASRNYCKILKIYARTGTMIHDVLYREKNPLFIKRYYPHEV